MSTLYTKTTAASDYMGIRMSDIVATAKISADAIEEDSLRKKIMEILLEDPDSEIKNLSESFLVQYLEDAINDIESNPVLAKFFKGLDERYKKLENQVKTVVYNAENKLIPDEIRNLVYMSDARLYSQKDVIMTCMEILGYLLDRAKKEDDPHAYPYGNYDYYLRDAEDKLNDAKNRLFYN